MKRIRKFVSVLSVAFVAMCCAFPQTPAPVQQTWFQAASGGDTLTVSSAVTVRFGAQQGAAPASSEYQPCGTAGGCWNQVTLAPGTYNVGDVAVFGADPIYGTAKELDVLETAAAQSVTVNGAAKTVPALPPPPHTIVLAAVYPPPCMSASQASCGGTWFGASNLPASGANDTWESAAWTVTVDGQVYSCTYQPDAYASGKFTFACLAAAAGQ